MPRPKVSHLATKVVTFRLPYNEWKYLHESGFNFGTFCKNKIREETLRLKGLDGISPTQEMSFTDQVIAAVNEYNIKRPTSHPIEEDAWDRDSFTHDEVKVIKDILITHGITTSQKAVYDVLMKVYITDRENCVGLWQEK